MNPPRTRDAVVTKQTQTADVRSWLAAIVDSSDDAIISKTLDGVILTWNQAAQRLFGYAPEEAVGQPITIIIPPELRHEEHDILTRLQAGERIDHYETRRITREGRYLEVSVTISPVRDAGGAIIGASKIVRDTTDMKRAQAALRESERRLASEVSAVRSLQAISTRLISTATQESLFPEILDAAIELMAADAASVQMLAADGATLILLGYRNFHPDSAAYWDRVTADAASTCGQALRDNQRVLVTDIEACDVMAGTEDQRQYRRSGIRAVQSTPLQSRAGRPVGMLSTHWRTPHIPTADEFTLFDVLARQVADLIERARAEQALRESEARFRLIANSAPVCIWITDANNQCTYVNQSWVDLTGRPVEAALGTGWMDGVHPDDVVHRRDAFPTKGVDRHQPFSVDYRIRRDDGEDRSVIATGVPMHNPDGSFTGYIGSAMDVTERRRAEEALATINQRLLDAQEEERARLGRELHDDINQRLAVVAILLAAMAQADSSSAIEHRQKVEEVRERVLTLSTHVQTLSRRLHPSRLEYLGIANAAAAMCREMSGQHAVNVSFHAESVPEGLSRNVSVCLYRVLQEALQNALKHSRASRVEVSLRGGADHVELTVHDSGAGFDPEACLQSGLGLTSMKERLTALHGHLAIESQPEQGTTIRASMPLSQG